MADDLERAKRLRASITGLLTKQANIFEERRETLTLPALNVMSGLVDDYYNRYTAASQRVIEFAVEKADLDAASAKDEEFAESYVQLKSQIMELIAEETPRKGSLNNSMNGSFR